jgi:transcriptional regulator with XRE-family HTH domain
MIHLPAPPVAETAPSAGAVDLVAPVAARIRSERRRHQLTWRTLARCAGMRPATLRRIEDGEQGLTAAVVGRIARALAIDEAELYPGGRPETFWARFGNEMRRRHQASLQAEIVRAA